MGRRFWFVLVAAAVGLLSALLVPLGLALGTRNAAWLVLLPVLLALLLFALVQLGLWGSRGNLPELLRGQSEPRPRRLRPDISLTGNPAHPPYSVNVTIHLDRLVAEISERYISVCIDTSQVVGGKWWNPQADRVELSSGSLPSPVFDFERPRLNALTRALAPAYLRVGGSEADKVFYDLHAQDGRQALIPEGYESAMTHQQWEAIHRFARRNDLDVVFTLNAGPASRLRDGTWDSENVAALLAHTARQGYKVAVWELGNEVNIFWHVHGIKHQVSVAQYCSDLVQARALIETHTPGARLAGQGSAFWPVLGEPLRLISGFMPAYLRRAGDLLDVVGWHYYPQQSRRGPMASRRAHPSRLLNPQYLDEAAHWADKIARWRDSYAPQCALWLGETGNAQFGGEPGVSDTYIGGLWWLDQLGLLARHGHSVVIRQSLTGMNYGLLDEESLEPRPDYWNSLLWRRLMGRCVLSVSKEGESADRLRVYAHAGRQGQGNPVTVLALNLDPQRDAEAHFPDFKGRDYKLYQITAPDVLGCSVLLNGGELALGAGDALPELRGRCLSGSGATSLRLPPLSYAFVAFGQA